MKKYIITAIRVLFLALSIVLIAKGRMQIWLIIFAASLIAALLFGRVFCGYICPMNTIMRPVSWLSKKMKWQTQNKPKFLGSGWLAFVLLLVSLPTMLMAKRFLQRDIPVLVIFFILSVLVTLGINLRFSITSYVRLVCYRK
jgi:polyferredoxin